MLNRRGGAVILFWFCCAFSVRGQEASYGLYVPVTISGEVLYGHGAAAEHGQETPSVAAAERSFRRRSGWVLTGFCTPPSRSIHHLTSCMIVRAQSRRPIASHALQAFLGYSMKIGDASLLLKAGQLSSAFGLFPVEYDDAKTAFVNPPGVYIANLPLRADQLACGVDDVLSQPYASDVEYSCGGSTAEGYGLVPVTLYGLPAVEADVSWMRLDTRLQFTNSSPANPHGLLSNGQAVQWTAGGRYSFANGLHLGTSGFRGPYLDHDLIPLLPAGTAFGDFTASGLGIDAEWSRGSWSTEGEWQRFRFDLPDFVVSPSESAAYARLKRILSPRAFVAARNRVALDESWIPPV